MRMRKCCMDWSQHEDLKRFEDLSQEGGLITLGVRSWMGPRIVLALTLNFYNF